MSLPEIIRRLVFGLVTYKGLGLHVQSSSSVKFVGFISLGFRVFGVGFRVYIAPGSFRD